MSFQNVGAEKKFAVRVAVQKKTCSLMPLSHPGFTVYNEHNVPPPLAVMSAKNVIFFYGSSLLLKLNMFLKQEIYQMVLLKK